MLSLLVSNSYNDLTLFKYPHSGSPFRKYFSMLKIADRNEWTHSAPKRMAERAQIILLGVEGYNNTEIAKKLRTRAARIRKWRTRFVRERL
jgi:DNA-binding NarL/FixJ family response regulator